MLNFVSNAIKFTPKHGKIEIGIISNSENQSGPVIFIKDNGLGMNEKQLGQLFRIEVKSSRRGTEGEASTGLGLILCKEFVEMHGGKIWAESEPGKGSTFFISLLAKK